MRKHRKHTKLIKPLGGNLHRNEWTIMGAPCDDIRSLVGKLSTHLQMHKVRCGYMDMQHSAEDKQGAEDLTYIDKINYVQLSIPQKSSDLQKRKYFNDLDLFFVNGNHYTGDNQIVIINEKKKESLSKKLDKLTNVRLIILGNGVEGMYEFLEPHLGASVQVCGIDEIDKISSIIYDAYLESMPPVYGLVLAGGKSQRMGVDKSRIAYYGKPHQEFVADILASVCEKTFISTTTQEDEGLSSAHPFFQDTFLGLGPYGGILSAFQKNPNVAWCTLACDLPYINEVTVSQLLRARNTSKLATCFYNSDTDLPEPLITIWEPRAYPILLDYLSQGYSCPRKVLIQSDIEMVQMEEEYRMTNANTPAEKAQAEAYISTNGSSL